MRKIIDLDLSNYFGTIDHELLMEQLSNKIQDKRFLRYIRRMFKAGVLSDGELTVSVEGVPQGSIRSPGLAFALPTKYFAGLGLPRLFIKST